MTDKPHGWINPVPNTQKAACGGPSMCEQCKKERDESWPVIDESLLPEPPSVIAARRLGFEPFEYGERN